MKTRDVSFLILGLLIGGAIAFGLAQRPRGTIECRADGTLLMEGINFEGITMAKIKEASIYLPAALCGWGA